MRDLGLLDAAAHRPQAVLYGREAYPELDLKAAALVESVVRNRALVDGDKRLGWLATVVFFGLNDVDLGAPDGPAYHLVTTAAGGIDAASIAETLGSWHR